MLKFTFPIALALAVAVAAFSADAQIIRDGARRTSQAVVEGGRAVVDGTRSAVSRTGQTTRSVAGSTIDAARAQVDRLERSELRLGGAGARNNDSQHYGTSMQTPMAGNSIGSADGRYSAGFRGPNETSDFGPPANYDGQVYHLRHDRFGREFICVNGRAVYFDDHHRGQPVQREAYKMNDNGMTDGSQLDQGPDGSSQQSGQSLGDQGSQAAPPAPPVPPASDRNNLSGQTSDMDAAASTPNELQTDSRPSGQARNSEAGEPYTSNGEGRPGSDSGYSTDTQAGAGAVSPTTREGSGSDISASTGAGLDSSSRSEANPQDESGSSSTADNSSDN